MSDYLWDKSGEPDEHVEQLEQKLSALRFKPPAQPLTLPVTQPLNREAHTHAPLPPRIAIAAALALMLLAGGLWLALHRTSAPENSRGQVAQSGPETLKQETPAPGNTSTIGPAKTTDAGEPERSRMNQQQALVQQESQANVKASNTRVKDNGAGPNPRRFFRRAPDALRPDLNNSSVAQAAAIKRREQAAEMERAGLLAKAQLMRALQIASDKLNVAQKKVQGTQSRVPSS